MAATESSSSSTIRSIKADAASKKLGALLGNVSCDVAREQFFADHPHLRNGDPRLRIEWLFRGVTRFPARVSWSNAKNATGMPQNVHMWLEDYLEKLYPGVPIGNVYAKAFVLHWWPESDKLLELRDEVGHTKRSLYDYVKGLLRDTVESMNCHEVSQKSGNLVNYKLSDADPSNAFEWLFAADYQFPSTDLSNWSTEELYLCVEALQIDNARVARVMFEQLDAEGVAHMPGKWMI